MKKTFILAGLLIGFTAIAQYEKRVGINTETPRASLEVKTITFDGRVQGILFPHINEEEKKKWTTNADKGLVAGTVIWNTDKECLDYFDGEKWQCTDGTKKNIHPTPWTPGGTTPIVPPNTNPSVPETPKNPTLPDGLTISAGKHIIASIYDTDYLPYTKQTTAAAWTAEPADGTPETNVIDHQGTIPAAGITVIIPVTYTGSVAAVLSAFTSDEISIHTEGEEGVTNSARKLVLSWGEQKITPSTSFIMATIKPVDGQVLNVKKLDLNNGLGTDGLGTLLVEFSLPKSNQNTTERVGYAVRVTPGIPDRAFGDGKHDFIYMPIVAQDGRIWLNNNLGAEYADVNNLRGNFNPAQQATHLADYKAFGSLFQWMRKADGHELITWKYYRDDYAYSKISGKVDYSYLTKTKLFVGWDISDDRFIFNNDESPYSWVSPNYNDMYNLNLWSIGGRNNPCPIGYHVPSSLDWNVLQQSLGTNASNTRWPQLTPLKLSNAGVRLSNDGILGSQDIIGGYWASDAGEEGKARSLYIYDNTGSTRFVYDHYRAHGFSVRCVQDYK